MSAVSCNLCLVRGLAVRFLIVSNGNLTSYKSTISDTGSLHAFVFMQLLPKVIFYYNVDVSAQQFSVEEGMQWVEDSASIHGFIFVTLKCTFQIFNPAKMQPAFPYKIFHVE